MPTEAFFAMIIILIGIPWLVLHYVTRWKTAPRLTDDDEAMLEELYQLARRLDERMETVERLTSQTHDDFTQPRLIAGIESDRDEFETLNRLRKERNAR